MLIMKFRGGVPYLSTEKGPVGFVEKMELEGHMALDGFVVKRIVIAHSGVKDNLNAFESRYVDIGA